MLSAVQRNKMPVCCSLSPTTLSPHPSHWSTDWAAPAVNPVCVPSWPSPSPPPLYSSASFARHHIANKESVGDQTASASLFLHRNANLANLFLSCSWTIFAFLYARVPKIPGTRQVVMCETRNVRLSLWNCNKYVQVYRNLVTVTSLMTNRKGAVFVR